MRIQVSDLGIASDDSKVLMLVEGTLGIGDEPSFSKLPSHHT